MVSLGHDAAARAREGRATSHHFGEHDYRRDRAAEENEKRLQQLEDEQPVATFSGGGTDE